MANLSPIRAACKKHGFELVEVDELSGFRDHFVTGTDMTILLGAAPVVFGTPQEVIDAKVGHIPRPFRETRRMKLGSYLESFLMAEYIEGQAERLRKMGVTTVAYQQPIVNLAVEAIATTDLTFWDKDGNLLLIAEVKTTGEEVGMDPPDRMKVQSAFQGWLGRRIAAESLFQIQAPITEIYVQQDLGEPKRFVMGQDDTLDAAFEDICKSFMAAKAEGDPSLVVLPDIDLHPDENKPPKIEAPKEESDQEDLDALLEVFGEIKANKKLAEEAYDEANKGIKALLSKGGAHTKRFILSGYYKKTSGGPDYKRIAMDLLAQTNQTEQDFPDYLEPIVYTLMPQIKSLTTTEPTA